MPSIDSIKIYGVGHMLIIHYHLLCEPGTEIIKTQISIVFGDTERKIKGKVAAKCPRVFKNVTIIRTNERFPRGEDTNIVR